MDTPKKIKQEADTASQAEKIQTDLTQMAEISNLPDDALMPELEELVKKNPNKLIGCGG